MTEPEHDRGDGREPLDEEAAWAQIVAAYDAEPAYGEEPDETAEPNETAEPDGDILTKPRDDGKGEREGEGRDPDAADADDGEQPLRSYTVYSAGAGPRDWRLKEPPEEEDHFVPPEPPPLPQADPVTKFAWVAVIGGPLLLIGTILFQQDMTWWISTLGVGGFLGGFGTLVARMRDGRDDDEFDDPGRGAVV